MARGGTLFVVATPLGHLGDLSTRVMATLRAVPVVAAEDTRRTRALLSHLDAHPRLISYHAHAAPSATTRLLDRLGLGQDVALVTDAGTPGISDPGAELVAQVRSAGFQVVPVPGPSAVAVALSAAGLPADRYVFLGFLPRKGAERARLLDRIREEEWTMVLFESPERIGTLAADLEQVLGAHRRVLLARELTKVHEELRATTVGELAAQLGQGAGTLKGECTLVVEGKGEPPARADAARLEQAADRLLAVGLEKRVVTELLTELFEASRNEAYRIVNRGQGSGVRE